MVSKKDTGLDIVALFLVTFSFIGVISTILFMVSIAPSVSYGVGNALNGFSNPYSFEEAQQCDFVATNVYEGSEYYITNNQYYPKALWEQTSKKIVVLPQDEKDCESVGHTWEPIGGKYEDCYGVYWSCMVKK